MADADETVAGDVVDLDDRERTPAEEARWWCAEINAALKAQEIWAEKGRKIEKRFHDERDDTKKGRRRRFNALYANVSTLLPAVYMQTPKPAVGRRWRQRNPVGRLASALLERSAQVSCELYDFDDVMESCVRDRLLPGRGQGWVVYEPQFYDEEEIGPDGQALIDEKTGEPQTYQALEYEQGLIDYVAWDDFLTSTARFWTEVRWGARRHFFARKPGVKRFGDAFKKVSLDNKRNRTVREDGVDADRKAKGVVWEVWDKESGDVLFIAPSSGQHAILERKPAPIKFREFFPFPRPLSASMTSKSTLPSPDYLQYQDQAQELDELTMRIDKLVRAIKVAGLYDAENKSLAKLFTENEGQMIAVENWAMHQESGGSQNQIEWYPVEKVITVLRELNMAFEQAKQKMYEVSGIADVMRGATDPSETLGAQQLKARWGSGRVRRIQKDVQRFAAELISLKCEIIAEVFQFETILEMAGVDQEMIAKYTPAGVDPQALMKMVEDMLRSDVRRTFNVKIETDSTLEPDEASEQRWRQSFLSGMAAMVKEVLPLAQQGPEGAKLAGEFLMLGVRGFKEADQLEEIVEQAVEAAGKAAAARMQAQQNAKPPQDPKMAEVQRKAQRDKAEIQLEVQDRAAAREGEAADRKLDQAEFVVDTQFRAAEHRASTMNGIGEARGRFDMAEAIN